MDKDDKFIMPFGHYKGEYLCDCPTSYLEWIEENVESEKIKNLATKELIYRENNRHYDGGHSD